jgi:hypothetical protein
MFHHITDGIPAHYSLNTQGQICITFSDPAYVRSDAIIFNRNDNSLHAVLNEGLHLIGNVEGDLRKSFAAKSEVVLSAPHYFSGSIKLKTPLVVSNG